MIRTVIAEDRSSAISRAWGFSTGRSFTIALAAVAVASALLVNQAFALSEVKREDLPPVETPEENTQPESTIPLPAETDPALEEPMDEPTVPETDGSDGQSVEPGHAKRPDGEQAETEIFYDLEALPAPVKRMRELIVEACLTGDPENLRPLIGTGENITRLAFGGIEGNPIEYLKQLSGDEGGQEILAILLEIFLSGYVNITDEIAGEMYVWPYFFAVPMESLDAKQRVELFKIVTAGDYEDMKAYGNYIFYRTAISPEGQWLFFLAGD